MFFQVLGPVEARSADGTALALRPGKPAKLLTLLLLHRNVWVSTDAVVDALWPDRNPPASAPGNIKTYVCGLRRVVGSAGIQSRAGSYRVVTGRAEVDVDVVDQKAAEAGKALGQGNADRAIALLTDALALWRGQPFAELGDGTPLPEVARLKELRWELRENLCEAYCAAGRLDAAVRLLRELTVEAPLRESNWVRLMTVLTGLGRRGEALVAYRDAKTVLSAELGVEPGAELVTALRATLAQHVTAA